MNTNYDILNGARTLCQQTDLAEEINTDLICRTRKLLREFKLYNDIDIKTVTVFCYNENGQKAERTGNR